MPFVAPLPDDNDSKTIELAKFFNETLGFCPNSVLTMHHAPCTMHHAPCTMHRRPAITQPFSALNMAVMENSGRVTSVLKRLIGYIFSNASGCRYCQAHSILAAQR